ncbi:MAG: alginate export family protein, partial [Deltaproteobacteria bacterium]|nr:alginate export family protein [Deltaproteobacteria bacterium]
MLLIAVMSSQALAQDAGPVDDDDTGAAAEAPGDDQPAVTPTAEAEEQPPAEPETTADEGEAQASETSSEPVAESTAAAVVEEEAAQPVKTFPHFGDEESVWGKLSLAYRLRPELRTNRDFNTDVEDKSFLIGQRARIGLGLHYQQLVSAFVQFQDTRAWGFENTSVSNPSTDGNTDLHQAWARLRLGTDSLALKVGRQQLVYGDQRLIGHLEWLDQGRVFDAAVLQIDYGIGRLDFFEAVFTPDNTGNLASGMTSFFGAYNAMAFLEGKIVFDLYVLGLFDVDAARKPGMTYEGDPESLAEGATAEEQAEYVEALAAREIHRQEITVGTRLRLELDVVKSGLEVAGQFGKADADAGLKRLAFAAHADVKAVIPVETKPFIGVEVNYATGDDDPGDDEANRFSNLFPTNHAHYGFMDLASWSNALNFAVRAGLKPSEHFALALDYWLLAKATTNDGWYNASGVGTAGATTEDERILGHEVDLTLKFPIAAPLKVLIGASVFFPTAELTTDPANPDAAFDGDPQFWAYT